jgi:hypothetical protein
MCQEKLMKKSLLLGLGRFLLPVPRPLWQRAIDRSAQAARKSLAFMTTDHHLVRDFVVREMPRLGEAIVPELIARRLKMTLVHVISILDELEENLTFLYRDAHGAVNWAYPVTVEKTPHQIIFNDGEQIYAA